VSLSRVSCTGRHTEQADGILSMSRCKNFIQSLWFHGKLRL